MTNPDMPYRIHEEYLDSLDEELEMELDDERLGGSLKRRHLGKKG
jgi:hypothetical protein